MERPVSIVWFERCYLALIVLGLVNFAIQWPTMMASLADNPGVQQLGPSFGPTVAIITIAITTGISLLLWYFAARKAAVVAKWIIAIFFVIALLGWVANILMHKFPTGIAGVLAVVGLVLQAIAVWNLFRPDAEAWFNGKAAIDSAARL